MARLAGILLMGGMVAALGACGSSAGSGTGAAESISLEAVNYHFSQTALSFPANTPVSVTIKNAGTVHHNFTIKELGVNQDIEHPGDSATVTFTTKGNATYRFYCEYHGTSNGMQGTLTVGSGGSGLANPLPSASASGSPLYGY